MTELTPTFSSTGVLDPLFRAVDTAVLTDAHLTSLAAGTLAALRVPEFLAPAACEQIVTGLETLALDSYDAQRVKPPILKFGPVLNDHRSADGLAVAYWARANTARSAWRRARLHRDPRSWSLRHIGAAWGRPVNAATIAGRRVFAGTLREINAGALVHYDQVVREYPHGLFDQRVIAQLAFNPFLSVPETGGATTVWRRCWSPANETHREGYGYTPDVIADVQHVTLSPRVGDGLFFDPRHYHAVAPSSGGRRIAFAFFLAITSAGQLIAWS